MAIQQISIFIENKVGALAKVTDLLGKENINIRALSIAETSDFGILRLIVDDVDKAAAVMQKNEQIYALNDVLVVAGEDKPGSIGRIISALSAGEIGMEYAYAFFAKKDNVAYLMVRVDDNLMTRAKELLEKAGLNVVDDPHMLSF